MAKRRYNNEGTVSLRPSGRHQAQLTLDGHRLTKTLDTKREANRWLREMANKKDAGLTASGASLTFSEYLKQWLGWKRSDVKRKTWDQYELIIRKHIVPTLGNRKLLEIRPIDLQRLYSTKRECDVSPRIIQLIHSVLHNSLNRALRLGMISQNPANAVDRPRTPEKEMKIFSEQEGYRFLFEAKGHRLYALFRLAITSGMRLGELLGLKWSDVDWASSSLQISRQLQRSPKGGIELSKPKTAHSVRTVQLGGETLIALMEHFEKNTQQFRDEPASSHLVFVSKQGNALRSRGVQKAFKAILEKAGLSEIRFHDLRHKAASLLLSKGMPVLDLSRQLGHSRASTTLDVYAHLVPGARSDATEKLDQIFSQTAAELQRREADSYKVAARAGENSGNRLLFTPKSV